MATVELSICDPGQAEAERFVTHHFVDLIGDLDSLDASLSSPSFRGGQSYADKALAGVDLHDYIRDRSYVHPEWRRAASRLSPYIRHGLLNLPRVWHEVEGPAADVRRFRLELLWQEYARHWYARLGTATRHPLNRLAASTQPDTTPAPSGHGQRSADHLDRSMGCVEMLADELTDEGWLVGQSRLWMASQWAVRQGLDWRQGEDWFHANLLDGSRAANRLGWQTAAGLTTGRPYQFSRLQVETRSPGLCASCDRNQDCPIDRWAPGQAGPPAEAPLDALNPLLFADPDLARTAGPEAGHLAGSGAGDPDVVWLTAESLGADDPALAAHPDLPAVFVFDRPLLAKLRLSSKRLVFLTETLSELASRRELHVYLGTPAEALSGRRVATTFAPVPGWRRHAAAVDPVEIHPWTWLHSPTDGDISTFPRWFEQVSGVPFDDEATETALVAIPMSGKLSYLGV